MNTKNKTQLAGLKWHSYLTIAGPVIFCIIIVLGLVSAVTGFGKLHLIGAAALLSVVITSFLKDIVFYKMIRCPNCNQRLNIDENGNKVPERIAQLELKAGHGCRHCGSKPN